MKVLKKIVLVLPLFFQVIIGMTNTELNKLGFLGSASREVQTIILGYLDNWYDSNKRVSLKTEDPIKQIKFSADGHLVACIGHTDKDIALHSIDTGKTTYRQHEDDAMPMSIAFSPNGKFFASGAENKIVLWASPKSINAKNELDQKEHLISPNGKYMTTGSVHVHPGSPLELYTEVYHEFSSRDVDSSHVYDNQIAFSANSKYIVGVFSGATELEKAWHTEKNFYPNPRINGYDGTENRWTDSSDGTYMAYYVEDKSHIEIYATGLVQLIPATDNICFMSFSHDGSFFIFVHKTDEVQNIVIYKNTAIHKWDLRFVIPVEDPVVRLKISPNGKHIAWITMEEGKHKNDKLFFANLDNKDLEAQQITLGAYEFQKELQFTQNSNFLLIGLTQPLPTNRLEKDAQIPFFIGIVSTVNLNCVNIIGDKDIVFRKLEGRPVGFALGTFKTHLRLDAENFPLDISKDGLYLAIGAANGKVHLFKNQAVELKQALEKCK